LKHCGKNGIIRLLRFRDNILFIWGMINLDRERKVWQKCQAFLRI
jgi:hypothetical protein